MSLLDKLKKNSRLEGADVLEDSKFFDTDFVTTEVPAINIALSGEVDGGLESGILMLAGPSKHFKSLFSLIMAGAYMKKYKDAVMMFYDSEFGSSKEYFVACGIDPKRVLHLPFKNIEELKFDIINQLESIVRGERVILFIDSVGNSASKKEVQDAIDENTAADMTRAKALKGLFRMVTPYLKIKNLPAIIVNHIYMTQEKFSKAIVSGGTGAYYSSQGIWIIGRQQDKDAEGLNGFRFIINIEKGRKVREKSKIPITVNFDKGVDRYSGLLEIAMGGGFIIKPKVGWYQLCDPKTKVPFGKNLREAETHTSEVWQPFLDSQEFKDYVKSQYKLSVVSMLSDEKPGADLELEPMDSLEGDE
jgi:hypothetical protein